MLFHIRIRSTAQSQILAVNYRQMIPSLNASHAVGNQKIRMDIKTSPAFPQLKLFSPSNRVGRRNNSWANSNFHPPSTSQLPRNHLKYIIFYKYSPWPNFTHPVGRYAFADVCAYFQRMMFAHLCRETKLFGRIAWYHTFFSAFFGDSKNGNGPKVQAGRFIYHFITFAADGITRFPCDLFLIWSPIVPRLNHVFESFCEVCCGCRFRRHRQVHVSRSLSPTANYDRTD